LTTTNHQLIGRLNLTKTEEVEWVGALGKKIHGFIIKPSDFDPIRSIRWCLDSRWATERLE